MNQDIRQRVRRPDYTRKILHDRSAPTPPLPTQPPPSKAVVIHKRSRKTLWVAGVLLVAVILVTGWSILSPRESKIPSFSDKLSGINVGFPLYYPSNLPSGYSFGNGTISNASGIVLFTAANTKGQKIAFTEQQKPTNYDFSSLSGTDEFNTPLGKGYVEDFDTRTTGSLVSDKTWIIVNTVSPIGADDMKQILNSLQPAKS